MCRAVTLAEAVDGSAVGLLRGMAGVNALRYRVGSDGRDPVEGHGACLLVGTAGAAVSGDW